MNTLEKMVCFAVLAAVSVMILRSFGWQGAKVVGVVAFVAVVSGAVAQVQTLGVSETIQSFGITAENAAFAGKVTGIGMLGGLCADLCDELGEEKIAKGVLLAVRVEILVLSFPILRSLLSQGLTLMTE